MALSMMDRWEGEERSGVEWSTLLDRIGKGERGIGMVCLVSFLSLSVGLGLRFLLGYFWCGGRLRGDDIGRLERLEDWDGGFAFSGFRLGSRRGGIVVACTWTVFFEGVDPL